MTSITMKRPNPQVPQRYPVAVIVTLLAMLLRLLCGHWFAATSPFLFFTPAVMLAAWYGGFGPGILATASSAVLANYFLVAPFHTFSFRVEDITRALLFVAVGTQISWLSGAMHTARQRAEADAMAARRSEKLYRTLASNFPDGFVCLFDDKLKWTVVAGAGLEMAGFSRERMEGQSVAASLPLDAAGQIHQLCSDAAAGKGGAIEISHCGRIYLSHALPLKSREGAEHAGMLILQDITERAHAREALQWAHDNLERRVRERTSELNFQKSLLESLSQASTDGILAIGTDGKLIFSNRRFKQIWRLGELESLQSLDDIRGSIRQHLELPSDPLSSRNTLLGIGEDNVTEMIVRDGRSIERYSAPIVDPDQVALGRVWFFRDITERKRLQGQILEAGERERQRIGQDLHDDLCQQLTGIACMARLLQQQMTRQNGSLDTGNIDAAADIVRMVQTANQRARDLAKGLQPVNLMRQGLATALQEMCESFQVIFKLRCVFRGAETAIALDEVLSIQLYRIAQEAMNNAVRHGHARQLRIDLVPLNNRLLLTIEDDGVGIPQPLPQTGLGLYTMSYRARMVRGTLTIEPTTPSGTVVTCSIPFKPDTPAILSSQSAS